MEEYQFKSCCKKLMLWKVQEEIWSWLYIILQVVLLTRRKMWGHRNLWSIWCFFCCQSLYAYFNCEEPMVEGCQRDNTSHTYLLKGLLWGNIFWNNFTKIFKNLEFFNTIMSRFMWEISKKIQFQIFWNPLKSHLHA